MLSSNPRPPNYMSGALPTELTRRDDYSTIINRVYTSNIYVSSKKLQAKIVFKEQKVAAKT